MPKPVLFTFQHSIWASVESVPQLAIRELGYAPGDGHQPYPTLSNPKTLILHSWTSCVDIPHTPVQTMMTRQESKGHIAHISSRGTKLHQPYLVKHAPKTVKPGTSFIDIIHEDKYDPNFPLVLARSDQDLAQKKATFVIDYIKNRQDALGRHSSQPYAAQHKAFYDSKRTSNGHLLSIYQGTASDDDKQVFFHSSTAHWNNLKRFISEDLANLLPDSGFLGGVYPGEDDFHLAAWLARMAFVAGAGKEQNGVWALENGFDIDLRPNTRAYWGAWSSRKSWQEVYAEGLH